MRDLTDRVEMTSADADAVDVEFAISGDSRAFERLYRRHVPRINSLARWLLGDDDVEDVVQDVFVRAWQKLGTFRGESAWGTWLHRLATNVILRRRAKRRTRADRFSGSLADLARSSATTSSPGLRVDLEAAVDGLPERARQVFVLHDMEGFKHQEIADALGISIGTSRSQLHHARMALRKHLEG